MDDEVGVVVVEGVEADHAVVLVEDLFEAAFAVFELVDAVVALVGWVSGSGSV